MNEELKRAAKEAGVVGVEHVVQTSYSDDRMGYGYRISHNIDGAKNCVYCQHVQRNLQSLAYGHPEV